MQLASLDLNLLVALDALLEEQSVTRAAERLFVGQPAMSATLAKLRSVFNDPLLVRQGRGLRTTPVAEALRGPLTSVLAEIQHLVDSVHEFEPTTSERVFTIVASDYVALVLLRPLLEHLATAAPRVQINVRPVQPGLLDDLARGVADLVIYPERLLPRNHPFRATVLFTDRFVCVADRHHPDITDELDADQFATLPFLAANQGIMRSIADEVLDEQGHRRNTAMTAQSSVVAPFLLPGTRMFSLIQERLVPIVMRDGDLRVIASPHPLPSIQEAMLWVPRNTGDPGLAWLRQTLSHLAAQLPSMDHPE